ncbi:divergent polysaccharide deacetylase family protein [Roseomonas xinghualingensis]|uniref:divergent polysaccharide deacetylase family protein n=1 Tax=Roseomonas xinghualingensis TaxID=2986475 RepID=UPI0021F17997|nr:divergent polysaccharide deacetylase family protein [Roseomonas sp. SXEYE001]MCV4208884.1 divergent polysaccharide deacetylase family protein [Roseomonas sp. SXEYE001]
MKALGVFWLLILAALTGAVLALHQLGPPEGGIPPSLSRTAPPAMSPATSNDNAEVALLPPSPPEPATPMPAPPAASHDAAKDNAPPPAVLPLAAPVTASAPLPGAAAIPSAPPASPAVPAPVIPPAPAPPALLVRSLPSAPEPPPLFAPPPRPEAPADRPIPPPDPALLEPSRHGLLPRIGEGGRSSIRAYGRPFDRSETRPKVSLVVGNLGLSLSLSEEAIRRLPPATGLAFSPYAPWPDPLLERARARGMEVLSALPLEPANYPLNDPGDRALLTSLSPAENADRLAWVLTRIAGQVGALGALGPMRGERFAALPETLGAVQDVMRARGLLYIDPRPGAASPARAWGRAVDLLLDEPATRGEIDRRLAELERIARERGSALGLAADVSPVLVDRVAAWAAGLESRGLVMAPVTALIRRPEELPRN